MVSIEELKRIEGILVQGSDPRVCGQYVQKIRTWLATGQAGPDVKRRLEQLVGRFGGGRFSRPAQRSG